MLVLPRKRPRSVRVARRKWPKRLEGVTQMSKSGSTLADLNSPQKGVPDFNGRFLGLCDFQRGGGGGTYSGGIEAGLNTSHKTGFGRGAILINKSTGDSNPGVGTKVFINAGDTETASWKDIIFAG